MTLNEYQQMALETAIYPEKYKVIYPALGIAGEAGECADKVKKVIRDGNSEFTDEKKRELAKEIGDKICHFTIYCSKMDLITYSIVTSRKV